MHLEHYSAKTLAKQIKQIIAPYMTDNMPYEVFFFGSRVKGDHTERSDIDIGIEAQHPIAPHILVEIQDELDNLPLLYKIDIVDFKSVNSRFYKLASQNKEVIN